MESWSKTFLSADESWTAEPDGPEAKRSSWKLRDIFRFKTIFLLLELPLESAVAAEVVDEKSPDASALELLLPLGCKSANFFWRSSWIAARSALEEGSVD